MSLSGHEDIPSTLRTPITIRLLDTIVRQLPSSQLQLGDQNLERAREIAVEFESVIGQNDRSIIEERITLWVLPFLKTIATKVRKCSGDEAWVRLKVGYFEIQTRSGVSQGCKTSIPIRKGCLRI